MRTIEQLEREAERQTKAVGCGFVVSRTDVLREAVAIGLAEIIERAAKIKREAKR